MDKPFVRLFFVLSDLEDVNVAFAERVVYLSVDIGMRVSSTIERMDVPLAQPPIIRSEHRRDNKSTQSRDLSPRTRDRPA